MGLQKLYVFGSDTKLLGRLEKRLDGYEFKYAKSYLDDHSALALNPVRLPLVEKTFFAKFAGSEEGFTGILSVFGDALPGAWGKAVLNAQANRKLTPFEQLLENQRDRIGHLVFSEDMTFPVLTDSRSLPPFQWEDILDAKDEFERRKRFPPAFSALFKQGASQGGARPKLSVIKNNQPYLAKLPTIQDYENKAQIEHGTLALAREVGIQTAESSLIKVRPTQDIFLTKRFDYTGQYKRPFLSMKALLAADHCADVSYGDFALALQRINGGKDSHEIFKRMLLNAMISNHDDHYLNHGVLWVDGQWRLSPAFDVVAGEGHRRDLAIRAGEYGAAPTEENLLSEHDKFSLTRTEAKDIFDQMKDTIAEKWEAVFSQNGVDDDVIQSISWAILDGFDLPVQKNNGS
ncbi:type II toxin-antitoxin system HipA family toxin [Hydrogenovibrio halophilus]|uniref:type II toxin-antitoxin system HipA family toxin n=1 Tax=Hydrogenovibrio halophilus TaxID=373391 RepID=UPI00037FEBB4|nr:HipA domain-containing protein [Hydrogenovibrio halophilus]